MKLPALLIQSCSLLLIAALTQPGSANAQAVPTPAKAAENKSEHWVVASKVFTESVILGELLTQSAQAVLADQAAQESKLKLSEVRHQSQLGGTRLVWNALLAGEIHAYVDYSGTLEQEILHSSQALSLAQLRVQLAEFGLAASAPLGFNNTYALGMRTSHAQALGIERISQLQQHPQLRLGFSHEFLDRTDGWPGLRQTYQLPQQQITGLDHNLAYRALESGAIELTDLYSTDAEVDYYHLRLLQDDRGFFPAYQALIVYRQELAQRHPAIIQRWQTLEGTINAQTMSAMNARVKLAGLSEAQVAREFLQSHAKERGISTANLTQKKVLPAWLGELAQRSGEHIRLVAISLCLALIVALPLGVSAAKWPRLGRWILSFCSLLQTIPSLALFVFLIPLLGIGGPPAVAALFLYSLLPIVRNTHAGLSQISPHLRDSARALGLSPGFRLWKIELPLASPTILAGIQTAAVINVGTATLAALIGAGGYGQPILTGIRLDDTNLIMQGAVPAALLALLTQFLFSVVERYCVPRGLRTNA